MNRFELWDRVARNSKCRFPQNFWLVVALWMGQTSKMCCLCKWQNISWEPLLVIISCCCVLFVKQIVCGFLYC